MPFQLSPSVNVTERDLTTIVPTIATTNAGFAGLFEWGPVNKRVTVSNVQDLVSRFGLPRENNFEYWFTAANYLGYGNNLQVVRGGDTSKLLNAGPTFGGTESASLAGLIGLRPDVAAASAPTARLLIDEDNAANLSTTTNIQSVFLARYPGYIGNSLLVSFCGAASTGQAGNGGATSAGQFENILFEDWLYRNQFPSGKPTSTSWADRTLGGTAAGVYDAMHLVVVDRIGLFSGISGNVLETYENLSVVPGAVGPDGTSVYYKTKINNSSKYIAALGGSNIANLTVGFTGTYGTYSSPTGAVSNITTGGVRFAAFVGGTGQWDKGDLFNSVGGSGGFGAFADADTADISLLMSGPATKEEAKVVTDIAMGRKDCIAFVSAVNKDPSASNSSKVTACTDMRTSVGNNNFAVIDSGYKYQYDAYNDTYRWVPLNGDIAGLCARTDYTNDPWYSPAGFNRGQIRGTIKLAFNPTQVQRDTIYSAGINPVVTFPGQGTILFGDRTAQTKSSAFDRINVRRLFIVLEKAIATAAEYSLFEFNDAFTRAQFRSLVEPFLRDVQARRGITDFKVVCNESNNTAAVIDGNRFVADIYIKPNRSINYIQLNFIATRTGVSFDEVGA